MDFDKVSKHDIKNLRYELKRDLSDQSFYQFFIGLTLCLLLIFLLGGMLKDIKTSLSTIQPNLKTSRERSLEL